MRFKLISIHSVFIISRPPNSKTEQTNEQTTDNNTNKRRTSMKKKILSIALVLAGLMGTSAMAQSPSTPQQVAQTAPAAAKANKMANPFEGLNLSEKQQAELKALREGCKAERQKIAEKERAEKKEMKEQRKKDTKEYLAKVKEILTPDQYVQFLENAYLNQGGRPFGSFKGGKQGMRQARNGKQAGQRAPKGQRAQRTNASLPSTQNAAM